MALGTLLGTIGGALASSAVSAGGNLLASKMGESSLSGAARNPTGSLSSFAPSGISAGGLTSSFDKGQLGIRSNAQRRGLVGDIAATFPEQADFLASLRGQVAPGIGRLTSSRLQQIEDARRRSVGNLRDNLARRRVLGSSFAGDALTRADIEFARASEDAAARSFIEELELTQGLAELEFNARRGEFQTQLDELNLQADLAAQLASGATSQLGQNARLKAELAAKEAAGAGQFFGQTFRPAINSVANAVGNAFGGPSIGPFTTTTVNAAGDVL